MFVSVRARCVAMWLTLALGVGCAAPAVSPPGDNVAETEGDTADAASPCVEGPNADGTWTTCPCGSTVVLGPRATDGSAPVADWTLPSSDLPARVEPPATPVALPSYIVTWTNNGIYTRTADQLLCDPAGPESNLYVSGIVADTADLDGDGLGELSVGRAGVADGGGDYDYTSVAWSSALVPGYFEVDAGDADFTCVGAWPTSTGPIAEVGPLAGTEPLLACASSRTLFEPVAAFADGMATAEEAVTEIVGGDGLGVAPLHADFDGDGVPDLVVQDRSVWLFSGADVGPGAVDVAAASGVLPGDSGYTNAKLAVDLLGTGAPQLLILNCGGEDCIWEFDEVDTTTLAFGEPWSTLLQPGVASGFAAVQSLGDGDADGRPELLLSDLTEAWWLSGSEAATPGAHTAAPDHIIAGDYGVAVDLGGEALPDAVVGSYDGDTQVFFDLAER